MKYLILVVVSTIMLSGCVSDETFNDTINDYRECINKKNQVIDTMVTEAWGNMDESYGEMNDALDYIGNIGNDERDVDCP